MNIQEIVAAKVQKVEDAEADALKAYIELKQSADLIADAMKQIKDLAIEELDNYPKRKAELMGVKAEVRNGASRYDFKHIHDWSEYKARLQAIEGDAKEAAKLAAKGKIMLDEDGVQVEPAKVTHGKETIFTSKNA